MDYGLISIRPADAQPTRQGPPAFVRVSAPRDFIYIAPGVPHQPRNLDPDRPARAVVARNTPAEQQSVVPYAA
jgi:hypothetical protein